MPQTTLGALVGGLLDAYGRKPVIPELPKLDIGEEQRGAITANKLALPGLEGLASETNRFSYAEISKMLESAVPGFGKALSGAGTNAASLVRGEIPEDVSRAVQSASAARSLSGGFGGTGLGRNLTARDLGLTSLNLTGEGQSRLLGLGGFARQAFPTFDFTNAFITPMQKLNFDWQQNVAQWQVKALQEQVKAAPDPADAALAEGLDNMFKTFSSYGMMMAGGGMGGGGGMAGMGGTGAGAGAAAGSRFGGGGVTWNGNTFGTVGAGGNWQRWGGDYS